jgi:hypothetical protein
MGKEAARQRSRLCLRAKLHKSLDCYPVAESQVLCLVDSIICAGPSMETIDYSVDTCVISSARNNALRSNIWLMVKWVRRAQLIS